MKGIRERNNILIQPAGKGRAIAVMNKECYKNKMKEQITEGYKIVGNNDKKWKKRYETIL